MKFKSLRFGATLAALLAAGLAAQAQTTITMSNLWSLAAGSRPYVSGPATNTERGIAINPINGHVYVVSRAAFQDGINLHIAILDGATGAELGFLPIDDSTGARIVTGGTLPLNCIDVAEDGVIYAANVATSAAGALKIYRWETETSEPTVAYGPAVPGVVFVRYGDSFTVRGRGLTTQIAVSGSGVAEMSVFTTADGANFTPTAFALASAGLGTGEMGKGLSFGTGNTLYGRKDGSAVVRHVSFDLGSAVLTKIRDIAALNSLAGISVDTTNKVMAALQTGSATAAHNLNLYDISDPAAASMPLLGSIPFPTSPAAANGNFVGTVDIVGTTIVGVDPNNGIVCGKMSFVSTVIPPGIAAQPIGSSILEGGYYPLTVSATGSKPFTYQWYQDATPVSGATSGALTLTNVTLSAAGSYTVVISNSGGSITSSPAAITITATARTDGLTKAWSLVNGTLPWLAADSTCRGLAYNAASGNLLVTSRAAGTNAIYVINSANGQVLRTLNTDPTVVFGGTYNLNMVGAGDDGAVYACNLTTDAGAAAFTVYRWDNDSADAQPAVIFLGDPANGAGTSRRYGDTFEVRGSGANTQILVTSRNANVACIISAADGFNWTSTPIQVADSADGELGLGVCFGVNNTFWAKAGGSALTLVGFDLTGYDPAGPPVAGTVLHKYGTDVFPGSVNNITVDTANNMLIAVATDTPDNVRLYDIADLANAPVLMDTEYFPTDNPNINGTGALDISGGKVYALDSNNGIVACTYKRVSMQPGPLTITRTAGVTTLTWTGSFKLQSSTTVGSGYTTVTGAASPYTVDTSAAAATFYRLSN